MLAKRLLEFDDLNAYNFPLGFKRPKFEAVRSFPINCGTSAHPTQTNVNIMCKSILNCDANARDNSLSNIKRPKVGAIRDFPKHCGPSHSGVDIGQNGGVCNENDLIHSDVSKFEELVPEHNLEKLHASHDKDDDVRNTANNENKMYRQEESLNDYPDKVTKLIGEAKECIKTFVGTYPLLKGVLNSEDLLLESKGCYEPSSKCDALHNQTLITIVKPPLEMVTREKDLSEKNVVTLQRLGIVDFADSSYSNTASSQQSGDEGFSNCKFNETSSFDTISNQQSGGEGISDCAFFETKYIKDECASLDTNEHYESLKKFTVDINPCKAVVLHCDLTNSTVNGVEELSYTENQKDLINLRLVQPTQPQGAKVLEALKMFEEQYEKVLQDNDGKFIKRKGMNYPHLIAVERVKAEGMWIYTDSPFGHIPGIEIGHVFRFRAELAVIGLHRQMVAGIDHVVLDGKKFATSVVNSGRYDNNAKDADVLIYCGQGGNFKIAEKAVDQKLEKGNLALLNSMEMQYPVRVTHKRKHLEASNCSKHCKFVYVYNGLYMVNRYWDERDTNGKLVYKFELQRIVGQPKPHYSLIRSTGCMVDHDVSQGKENKPIHAMNEVDSDRPQPFVYVTNIAYPHQFQHTDLMGCNCVNGCSGSSECPCILKNGGEIPFNKNGAIMRAKPMVHECGPWCKCPPCCMNRVSQHGPKHELEIFKTKSRGWGVRSRTPILSGSFICEYVGELLLDTEAEERVDNDEYLFDICADGYAIDAAKMGNIGRFINHSCSPNLYAQEVLYDHEDTRMPHIMFFATKNIPALQELVYHYNYKIGRVCDADGNIKRKDCYCGSSQCSGRMY